MCDSTGLQKCVEDSSVDTSRVMAAEACLGRLYPRLATSIEAAEEQTFEDFAEYSDQCDGPDVIRILWPSVVFDDQTHYGVVPSTRSLCISDTGVIQCCKDMDERCRSQYLHQTDVDAIYTTGLIGVLVLELCDDLFDRNVILGRTVRLKRIVESREAGRVR
jgi:hypothetical protein